MATLKATFTQPGHWVLERLLKPLFIFVFQRFASLLFHFFFLQVNLSDFAMELLNNLQKKPNKDINQDTPYKKILAKLPLSFKVFIFAASITIYNNKNNPSLNNSINE